MNRIKTLYDESVVLVAFGFGFIIGALTIAVVAVGLSTVF